MGANTYAQQCSTFKTGAVTQTDSGRRCLTARVCPVCLGEEKLMFVGVVFATEQVFV